MRPRSALLAMVVVGVAACSGGAVDTRRVEVAERGAMVMPFDLERTTHRFEPLPDGGRQAVEADDPADAEQITLIREHLTDEATRLARGDLADPAAIHGHDMPGLAALEAGANRIEIEYQPISAGGAIRYRTGDGELVEALHEWFAAQVRDHGSHAEAE